MTVSAVLVIVMAVLFATGVYAVLERSLTRVLIGFLLLGNAANLLLLIAMGAPGIAPFYGDEGEQSDPLPQALMLTAIVITFAVSAFLLALIYRSWQLGQADTVQDDAEDVALRERAADTEDAMEDESDDADVEDEATTDFIDVVASPLTVLGSKDAPGLADDAPVDRPSPARRRAGAVAEGAPAEPEHDGPEDLGTDEPVTDEPVTDDTGTDEPGTDDTGEARR